MEHRNRSPLENRDETTIESRITTEYRNRSPTEYRNQSPTEYRNRSPTEYRNRSPFENQNRSTIVIQDGSPTEYRNRSPLGTRNGLQKDYCFAGKVVLITGASSGIGAGTALHFAKLGASLSLAGRNSENLANVAAECAAQCAGRTAENHYLILTTVGDITSREDQKRLVERTIKMFGKLDVLVNNAGMILNDANMENGNIKQFDMTMDVNVRSVIGVSQLCIEALKASHGCVVNLSSYLSIAPSSPHTFYGIAKAEIDQFTKCFAMEMAPFGVRVNAVNPATVRTPIFERSGLKPTDMDDEAFYDTMGQMHPLGRAGSPEDVANAIAYLAHDSSSGWITGVTLPLDGGMLLSNPGTVKSR